jgi:DNA-binding MarR family transcriptional regulator
MAGAEGDRRDQEWYECCRPPAPGPGRDRHQILFGEVGDQCVKLAVGLCCVTAVESLLQLIGVEPPRHVLLTEDLGHPVTVLVRGAESGIVRLAPLPVVVDAFGHFDPFHIRLAPGKVYTSPVDSQVLLRDIRPHVARLAPLMPALAFALRRRRGQLPPELREAGGLGERHIATLVSLAVAGPGSVSEVGERMDMSLAHASLVVGELGGIGLVDRDHDDTDRRRIIVSLSDKAKPAVAKMSNRHAAPLVRFLSELEDDEATRFIDQLARLVAYLREG